MFLEETLENRENGIRKATPPESKGPRIGISTVMSLSRSFGNTHHSAVCKSENEIDTLGIDPRIPIREHHLPESTLGF